MIDDMDEVMEQIDSSIEELGAYIQDVKDWEKEENSRNLALYKKEIRGLEDADELLKEYIKVQKFDSILPGYRSEIKNMKKMSEKLTTIKYNMNNLYHNRGLYHGVLIPYP